MIRDLENKKFERIGDNLFHLAGELSSEWMREWRRAFYPLYLTLKDIRIKTFLDVNKCQGNIYFRKPHENPFDFIKPEPKIRRIVSCVASDWESNVWDRLHRTEESDTFVCGKLTKSIDLVIRESDLLEYDQESLYKYFPKGAYTGEITNRNFERWEYDKDYGKDSLIIRCDIPSFIMDKLEKLIELNPNASIEASVSILAFSNLHENVEEIVNLITAPEGWAVLENIRLSDLIPSQHPSQPLKKWWALIKEHFSF